MQPQIEHGSSSSLFICPENAEWRNWFHFVATKPTWHGRLAREGPVWSSGFSLPRSVQPEGWTPNLRALHFHALWVCAAHV